MKWIWIIGAILATSASCQNKPVAATHKTVLELFTSEGCSSCPPAERYAEELAKDTNILILSYHVDYWNRLGWTDPYSDPSFSAKQYRYKQLFHLSSVYTPQAIINGKAEAVGSDRKLIPQLIVKLGRDHDPIIRSVQTSFNNNLLSVKADCTSTNISLEFLLVQKEASTKVLAGENNGAVLHHLNIVRQFVETKNSPSAQFSLKKTEDLHQYKIVVLVREANNYSIQDAVQIAL